jgi:hypothetical protein
LVLDRNLEICWEIDCLWFKLLCVECKVEQQHGRVEELYEGRHPIEQQSQEAGGFDFGKDGG